MAELPTFLGSYRVQHQIGVGTLGPIFLTSDEVLHVTAAVKVFDIDATPDEIAALVQRLNAAAARLSSHPGVIKLFEAGVANHLAYLATENAEGMSLDARLRERDAALPSESLGWLEAMADAVDAVHADGVDHGSLHPRDVVLTLDGPRISGCGVVRAVEEVGLRAPVRLPYTAPERAAGPSWGPAADVFSLAAIAFECLAGRRPTGTGRAAAKRLPPTVSPEYDRALVDVFARGLSADAERRPPSARAFVQGLLDAGAAYVYGGDAKRGAVHHRAGTRPRPAVKPAAAEITVTEGAAAEGELARFARDGVLPEASGSSRQRRRASAAPDRQPAPEPDAEASPSEASDPLTLFQAESDEPAERRLADEAGARGAKGNRRRTNGATTSATHQAASAMPPSEPADLREAANGADAESGTDPQGQAAEDTVGAAESFTPDPPEEDSAQLFDEEVEPEGEPLDVAHGKDDPGTTSARAEEEADRPTSAGARGESEGWLASTMAVPLVDAQDEVEYPPQRRDAALGRGGDARVPDERFLDVEAPTDHASRRQGPSELGGAMAGGGLAAAGGMADPDAELTASLDIGPNGRDVEWPLERPSTGAADVGGATLFAGGADDWDEAADTPRRRRILLPLLLLLLAVAAGAWFYAALTMPPETVPGQASDPDAVSAPPPAGETSDTAAAGSGAAQEPPADEAAAGGPAMPPADQPSNAAGPEPSRSADVPEAAEATSSRASRAQSSDEGAREARAPSAKPAAGGAAAAADQRPERGRLLVRTSPSATITVDGAPRGSSPLAVYALDWGPHTVVASRPGYAEVSRRVMIAPDAPAVTVTIDLREEGAGGNASEGSTSTAAEPDGPATAGAATAPDAQPAAPSPSAGAIVTVTRPTGAEIFVDGQSAGRTPATIPKVTSGSHTVRFELAGYRAWETRVIVEPGQRVRIAASLDRDR